MKLKLLLFSNQKYGKVHNVLKHYIFHCTMDKLGDIRKDFVKELHESNLQLQSCFNDAAFSELTGMILKGTCCMKLDKIGKFLSAVLERTDASLRETK